MIRIEVKLAGSMPVDLSASRQSKEFPANAIIASEVRKNVLLCGIVIRVAELYTPSFCLQGSTHLLVNNCQ